MELKSTLSKYFGSKAISSNRTFMELKCSKLWYIEYPEGSNRTFMELKLRNGARTSFWNSVLIVPLWNWNESCYRQGWYDTPF